jgi:Ca2+-binding EF-hand superfamily protein
VQQPQFAFLKNLMELADRDEDGKLTEKEVTEFGEVMSGFSDSLTVLSYSDSGQGLFDLLDTNRDGRLSIRELRQAWNRLRQHDVDGDGLIRKDELPRQCQLAVTRGAVYGYAYYGDRLRIAQAAAAPPQGPVEKPAAPVWFLKMDLNGDGDVSPREFLGTLEDFARIDTDGDGLISLEEALKADQWLKDKAKSKP